VAAKSPGEMLEKRWKRKKYEGINESSMGVVLEKFRGATPLLSEVFFLDV
jgi:hypothetical protein